MLTDDAANQEALKTSLGTLTRVLEWVDWPTISKDKPEAWLYFYEDFLEVYDNALRKRTGSYYTPPEVVNAMVRLVDEALRNPAHFDLPSGLASPDVTLADPAVGTGTFLLGVFRRIAETIEGDQGAGAVAGAVSAAASRLIGFEIQFGPFAVAQLRLVAEMRALIPKGRIPDVRLYVTDTLGNPYVEDEKLPQILQPIARSRKDANAIKRGEPITVVIGNPPYKVDAAGRGGWIEAGSSGRPSALDLWVPPPEWGVSQSTKHLKNLYVYFWRWATWKVFGSGHEVITGEPEKDHAGIVCFITAAGFLNGPGFQKMREDLRRDCAEIWVIDCSPEGHQPDVPTRIFEDVQQRVCIVLAARTLGKDPAQAARVRYTSLPVGRREQKFDALSSMTLDGIEWIKGPTGWREPFLPEHADRWAAFVALSDLFQWSGPGVQSHRTWVIAPDAQSLKNRWDALRHETDATRKARLFHPDRDRTLEKVVKVDLGQYRTRLISVGRDGGSVVAPIRYAFRSFDRQWIVPDHRLLSQARSRLWDGYSEKQIYLTALEAHSPTSGPAVTFAGLIPDRHHYKGSFGGYAYPLWRDRAATQPNVSPEIMGHLADVWAHPITTEDVMAYLAAIMAHPAFTVRFTADLVRPGLRLPLTADAKLFAEAVTLGREIVWLHCHGERLYDPSVGRPKQAPRLPKDQAPYIPAKGAFPSAPEPLPDSMDYDAATRRLRIGKGYVENVTPEMWNYEVSGKQVVWHWFSYRKRDRTKPIIGDRRPPSPLDQVQPDHWLPEYTTDLLDLLNVLGRLVTLEPKQADLLERICAGPLLSRDELEKAGVLPKTDEDADGNG